MKETDLRRIAKRLHNRAAQLQHLELVREQDLGPYLLAKTPYEQISAAFRLKQALLAEFAGAKLEELYDCTELDGQFGRALLLEDLIPQRVTLFDRQRSHQVLSSQLRLLYGIGPEVERKLRGRGYQTIQDLGRHPYFGPSAASFVRSLQNRDLPQLKAEVEHWFSVSHPLTLALTGLVDGDIVFFDIESLGLFGRPLVLLGLAKPRGDGLLVQQYMIRSITEELPAIIAAAKRLEQAGALVTYNGRAFDVKYLEERLAYYGFPQRIAQPNFDLLFHARRRFRDHLPDCRLDTVERHVLGIKRPLDIPSALVPEFYNTYLEEQNIGPLVAILQHNKQDLTSLAALLGKFCSD